MASSSKDCMHKIKMVKFLGRETAIVLQNDNGLSPLLAICNVLLLENKLELIPNSTEVSQKELRRLVTDRLIQSNSNLGNKDEVYVKNQQQNIADAIEFLPRLTTGIDVNVKYTGIGDFEFTEACTIFDMLGIHLYHGWIVDPEDPNMAKAIGSKSHNALTKERSLETRKENIEIQHKKNLEEDCVDFVAAITAALGVLSPHSVSDQLPKKGKLIKSFLENEASQLTSHGLGRLKAGLTMRELCVFFRNNNFSTMFKNDDDELYLLVTDEGYINQRDPVWEKLNKVNGDTSHVTSNFEKFEGEATQAGLDTNSDPQIAHVLQQEEYDQ